MRGSLTGEVGGKGYSEEFTRLRKKARHNRGKIIIGEQQARETMGNSVLNGNCL